MENLLDFNLDELKKWMKDNGESEFRAKQVFDWIYKYTFNFDDMENLPLKTRAKLKEFFCIEIPEAVRKYKSKIDGTYKFLFKYSDGSLIESVVMKYKYGNTICVSTQVGCRMGCKFCASTIGGLIRNLKAGEILGEVIKAQKEIGEKISHVVLMGSGEPLDNFENVMKFIELVNSKWGLDIGQRHITLSTCGIVPQIIKLADKKMQITLAISLHAPYDELRRTIMPVAFKYTIDEIISACKYYIKCTNRRISFEYSLIEDVNDSKDDAYKLCKLLSGMLCHVNLIPINEIKERNYRKTCAEKIKVFSNVLTSCGIETTIRRELGEDINAACGQLRRSYINEQGEL